jgi:hypothetical protein
VADNNFRSDRDRDPLSRDSVFQSDPLAELARLIGQTDAYAEPESRSRHDEEHYAPPPPPLRPAPPQSYGTRERDYEQGVPADRHLSAPPALFNNFREDAAAYSEPPAIKPQTYAPAPVHESNSASEPEYHDEEEYVEDDYYEQAPAPRRRSGLVVVMAIFALAVVGTAGAFGYRAMFGGSLLPTLPPIIKAGNGPNKIVPAGSDAQANAAGPQATASAGSGENLVSREEQPVSMEPPRPAPRVVSTIPIVTGQGSAPSSAAAPNSPWPPSPVVVPPPPTAAPAPTTQVQAEAKKVHTVIIRSDQTGASDAMPAPASAAPAAPASPPAARTAPRPQAATPKASAAPSAPPPAASNAPLSIVPGSETTAASPPRTRVAAAPAPIASGGTAAASSGGGYAVQVTSQRSEAEAQASFRELQAKYPNQLSGRQPIIRRADLGAKGTYYRALVGPFASAEEAAGLCSGLKSAGGSCLIQKN